MIAQVDIRSINKSLLESITGGIKSSGNLNKHEHLITVANQLKKQRGRAIEFIIALPPEKLVNFCLENKISCSDLLKKEFSK